MDVRPASRVSESSTYYAGSASAGALGTVDSAQKNRLDRLAQLRKSQVSGMFELLRVKRFKIVSVSAVPKRKALAYLTI